MTDPLMTLGTLLKLLVIWVCIMALELAHVLVTATRGLYREQVPAGEDDGNRPDPDVWTRSGLDLAGESAGLVEALGPAGSTERKEASLASVRVKPVTSGAPGAGERVPGRPGGLRLVGR